MDVLEKLRSKHDKLPEKPVLDCEMQSDPQADADDPVAILTKYMQNCHGFYLFLENIIPVLHFSPGVSPKDGDRWDQAKHACILLADALDDLLAGILSRRIKLPPHPGYFRSACK